PRGKDRPEKLLQNVKGVDLGKQDKTARFGDDNFICAHFFYQELQKGPISPVSQSINNHTVGQLSTGLHQQAAEESKLGSVGKVRDQGKNYFLCVIKEANEYPLTVRPLYKTH
ncbi:MAG TPA: hypothetical protein VK609_20195, partial [Mucilaginibacter sp.]|nr:hypothetical protein [Mucilaginibacter sp.]